MAADARPSATFITDVAPIERILEHIGEQPRPPRIAPARGPPAWEDAPVEFEPDYDPLDQPGPEIEFDQRIQW